MMKTTSQRQAALLVTNGLAVLNNDRCLEKCKEGRDAWRGIYKKKETKGLKSPLLTLSCWLSGKKKNEKKN